MIFILILSILIVERSHFKYLINLKPEPIYSKALALKSITLEEGLSLYNDAPTGELIFVADQIRQKLNPGNKVTWIIDRNVNITNICISKCKFCNFYRGMNDPESYITTIDEYKEKIEVLFKHGGNQVLLQGGPRA